MKKLFIFISSLFAYPFLAFPTFAVTPTPTSVSVNPCAGTGDLIANTLCRLGGTGGKSNIAQTIQNIVVFFIVLAVIIALLYLLYGGIKWITSGGKKEEIDAARSHIIAAVIGLMVVFLAIFILSIILAAFGLSVGDLKIPIITPSE